MNAGTSRTLAGCVAGDVRHREPAQLIASGRPQSVVPRGATPVIARGDRHGEKYQRHARAHGYEPAWSAQTGGNFWVAEGPPGRFVIGCKFCGRQLMTVDRLRDPELRLLEDHLRTCCRLEPLGDAPPLGKVLHRLSVATRTET